MSADKELSALWQVLMKSAERNLSDVPCCNELNGTDTMVMHYQYQLIRGREL
jgi:hypothetical protein